MNLSDFPQKFLESDSHLNYPLMKKMLNKGLYYLSPSFDSLTKHHLALLSTPGVAEVCLAIHQNNALADKLTMRGKSVAIVLKQQVLGLRGKRLMPFLDWLIVQIKFYSGIQCYPFIVRQQSNIQQVFSDLSNSFCGILYLDDLDLSKIETKSNFFVLKHRQVCQLRKCSISEGQFSAYAMAHLVNNQIKGVIKKKNLVKIINLGEGAIKKKNIYPLQKQITQYSSYQIHELIQGKTKIELNFKDIRPLKRIFTQANLMRLKFQDQAVSSVSSTMNAIVTDGTSILGLGNIGPVAGLPVMQAKCMMFNLLGKVNIVPICINARQSQSQTVSAILNLTHLLKAINLEDIRSPECFSIEKQLQERNLLPVFHDDQHGTSIAVLAGLINATKIANKDIKTCKIIINGAGAAGLSIARLLYYYGSRNIIVCDTFGVVYEKRFENMNSEKNQVSSFTNIGQIKGSLEDVIEGADIFIGVSTKDTFKKKWIKAMSNQPIIFALANPEPEISEEQAVEGGCFIYASGKNNRRNQVSNSLVYPGIFRAINQHHIMKITNEMKIKAAEQIARIKGEDAKIWEILPSSLNQNISFRISQRLKQLI